MFVTQCHFQRVSAMTFYPAVFFQTDLGEWHGLFPDVPECVTRGFDLLDVTIAAKTALSQCARMKGSSLLPPRSLKALEADTEWLARNRVVLSKAVLTLVPLAPQAGDQVSLRKSA
jgi:predicted RNase H-like HicB family nuclease